MIVDPKISRALELSANRHIFSRFRRHVRIWASLVYLSFGVFDYLYSPKFITVWMSLRVCTVVLINGLFLIAVYNKSIRKNMSSLAILAVAFFSWPIVVMMYQSGGYQSLYSTGLILCGTTGLQIFRLRNRCAIMALSVSYIPGILVIFSNANIYDIHLAILKSGFLFGMFILSIIYGSSEDQIDRWWIKFKKITNDEIDRLQKTEILKNHFPKVIREMFEKQPEKVFARRLLPNAVVGFADIVSSSQLSNLVTIPLDWETKEKFLEAATRRAIESEMVVLTHLGDGFLFLANFNEQDHWYFNLISFYENLVSDFKRIYAELNLGKTGISSGVKFGVSSGPVMVGFLGRNQSYFTAVGPDVNLASRLCALAEADQIVVSTRVWQSISPVLVGWVYKMEDYGFIKGFNYPISAVHISPRSRAKNQILCDTCGKSMTLIKTTEGFLDYRCEEGHSDPQSSGSSSGNQIAS